MNSEEKFPTRFNHQKTESQWYKRWEEAGIFTADPQSSKKPFCIVIPPPNVTGTLHIGHALNNTLQDILARYKRMDGHDVLWLPGTDHAGIATENVVEKELLKKGVQKRSIGREKFIEEVWKWKEEKGGKIIYQLKRLGASCDWTRERFTMDEGLSRAVFEAFKRLYERGLIYRGDYIINWCPRCHTALSDLEVEAHEHPGKLFYIRYPFKEGSGGITVATTRPETMLGDTAVAFHPEDERYAHLEGKVLILPLVNREIPFIADKFVDPKFGTGAVKITPAHDFNDFLVAQRHNLPRVKVINEDAIITEEGGKYAGLTREEAREKIVEDLEKGGFLEKVEDYTILLGRCYRCKTVVEPLLSRQWFVSTKPLAEPALNAVREGRIRIIPEMWKNSYYHWMENIRDWCISRQIWWGHRIPVWWCKKCGTEYVSQESPDKCERCGSFEFEQETDVLDTWFSSALWPFSTLGWPDETPELKRYYPTSVLVSGFDILFFWVARMIMMGLEFMGDVPFRDVYIHALIRDEKGEKMSKSKGNVIDPLVVMEKYGTDAFRFTLAILAAQGRDIKLSETRIESYRNFVTKFWNASRFVYMNTHNITAGFRPDKAVHFANQWIISRLRDTCREVREKLNGYEFDRAAQALYQFTWHEYCDWFIESSKLLLKDEWTIEETAGTLRYVLESLLRLLHPFMPFVTEEIHSIIFTERENFLPLLPYPSHENIPYYQDAEEKMKKVKEVVTSIRNVRSTYAIPPSRHLSAVIKEVKENTFSREELRLVSHLANLSSIKIASPDWTPERGTSRDVTPWAEIYIPLEGIVDFKKESEKFRKKLQKARSRLEVLEEKLTNEQFTRNAPPHVVSATREEVEKLREEIENFERNLKNLEEMAEL